MKYRAKSRRLLPEDLGAEQLTLATVLAALEHCGGQPATRLRDMRSAVNCLADLLGNEPAAIPLDMHAIAIRLSAISPLAVGMSAKRFANPIRLYGGGEGERREAGHQQKNPEAGMGRVA